MSDKPLWDIFCVVVDNYGDIGVTWRLARQLVAEHPLRVRLWVDDLQTFVRLCPEACAEADRQVLSGVEVRRWWPHWPEVEPADVVIEAFACALPPAYVDAMRACGRRILWLNLEYLSAEDWVVGCHGLPSLQGNGLQKFFFFPGFQPGVGGVTRESGLLPARRDFQHRADARAAFLARWGLEAAPGTQLVSLFAYENAAIAGWLEALSCAAEPTLLLVPAGRALPDVARWLGVAGLAAGERHRRGALAVAVLPFVDQDDYDRLLWACDFNAVRGEESFLRAQWAERPFVWHIYPQAEDAHWDKLWAFFRLYGEGLSDPARGALEGFWRAWNDGEGAGQAWNALRAHESELLEHAGHWCAVLESRGDLAGKLVCFYTDWL